jgi:glucosamine--fructose-6-phosphate aminotransferase (isomerizing)
MMSNLREIVSRKGKVIAFGNEGDEEVAQWCEVFIGMPAISEELNPILLSVAWQLLAYHAAIQRKIDVDRPRNLAKSVTVD